MRWRVNRVAVVAVTAVVTVASCSQTVSGTAQRAQRGVPDLDRDYGYVHDRCGLLADETVRKMVGADHLVRPYSGAVCQYVLTRGTSDADAAPDVDAGPPQVVDVTFSWFETGRLDRERALADDRGAKVTDTVVDRRPAFLARRDTTGAACSATASAGTGVLSWWVQLRGKPSGEPCVDAERLLSATLQADM